MCLPYCHAIQIIIFPGGGAPEAAAARATGRPVCGGGGGAPPEAPGAHRPDQAGQGGDVICKFQFFASKVSIRQLQ